MAETFISAYLKHTLFYETPLSFWRWSAYSTISTVLRDKCYIKNGDSLLFPNTYVLFIAESSGHRKNRPVEFSEDLASKITGTKTISGRASVQALIDELNHSESDSKTGKVIKSSSATFYAPELSAGIVADPEGLRILTDIYDYKMNTYKARLRSRDHINLDKMVFSMLSASNQDMLNGLFDQAVIKGGFMARTLLVVPNEFRNPNSLMRIDHDLLKKSKERLLDYLREVSLLKGEFKVEEEAIKEYEAWYNPFRKNYMQKKDATGVIGRVHTHVVKVAMILAANELVQRITKKHIEESVEACLSLMPNYNIFTMNNSKNEIGQVGGIIITDLLTKKDHMLSRKDIVRQNWQTFDVDLLDKAVTQLETAGFIRIHSLAEGIHYQLTQTCLDMLK